MAAVATRPAAVSPNRAPIRATRRDVFTWYVAGALLAFAVPLVGASWLGLHHDLYLLVYFTVMGVFLASFVAHMHFDLRTFLRTRMWWSLGTGAAVAFTMVRNVMNETSMPHPSGAFYWFEVAWRGVLYGTFDAMVLFVFPATVAYLVVRDVGRRRRLRFAGVAVLLSFGITATYHLGYPQFRGGDLVQPEIGAVMANVPTVLTGNPVGAIVVHDVFHVSANVHTYRSATFLPPDLEGYAENGSGAAGPLLAVLWLAVAATVVYAMRHRLFPPRQPGAIS